ncbi:MAG: diguanylate cyclase, partial [Lysobacteraceae bacterium]
INDTFGHDVGDLVLRTVAKRLKAEIGEGQVAARIGGDEFVVAASNLSRQQVIDLAERLIEAVSQPIAHGERWLEVGLSIGIALTPQDTLEEDELFRFADVALYRSKGNQRGTFTFYGEETEASAEAERHLGHDLMFGIKAGQFALECHLRTSDCGATAIEVLPKWNHPALGQLGAERFIRVAEQSGLIVALGEWIVRSACKLAIEHPTATVCVPVYPKQLLLSDVPEMLILALRERELAADRLELRLQRGSARVNIQSLRTDLDKISGMGISIAAADVLLADDMIATRASWSVDRIIVDARLRSLLRRQANPLAEEIEKSEQRQLAVGDHVFEVD